MRYSNNLMMVLAAICVTACSDWDDHYDNSINAGNGLTIMETLEGNPQTTRFAELVNKAGYAELLNSTQSFTVFAPINDALTGFDENNTTALTQMVTNHIARYTHPSSTPGTEGVRMIDGKIYYFDNTESFAGSRLNSADERADNGLVHHLSSTIPYIYNLYEYIQSNENTSKLYDFISRFDENIIDMDKSIETGIDDQGRPVYDTVLVRYNRLLDEKIYGLGSIATEDSSYTMLIPDNTAWDQAYERIAPSFANYNADQDIADSIQDVRTCLAIVSDLIYREAPDAPAAADSLVSTSGSVIHSPSGLFANATYSKMSNGVAYTVSELAYDNAETWNKEISVEAEQQNGRTYNNTQTAVYSRNVTAESKVEGISNDSYIEVSPMTTSAQPTVIFDIPNVLAGKYNVYAVFLPPTVEGEVDNPDSTYISFTISYLNSNGRNASKSSKGKTEAYLTSSSKIVKMLAFEEIEFPVSNYTDRLWLMDESNDATAVETTTKLTIATNVTNSEFSSKKFGRTFRLDRIILEPIKK